MDFADTVFILVGFLVHIALSHADADMSVEWSKFLVEDTHTKIKKGERIDISSYQAYNQNFQTVQTYLAQFITILQYIYCRLDFMMLEQVPGPVSEKKKKEH